MPKPRCAAGAQPPEAGGGAADPRRIVKDANRAGDVVSRIRGLIGKAPPQKSTLAINEAIREVLALLQGEAVKHGVSVRTRLAEGLPLIKGDRVQLQQVILNLIVNAIEAMASLGDGARDLLISTEADASGAVRVSVRDSGPGLDPQSGAPVRGVLHDQARRPGHGAVDLPLDHRGAWRTVVGICERTAGPCSSSPCLQKRPRPFLPSKPAKRP